MPGPQRNAHCSYCGTIFVADSKFPRTCASCTNITYVNPTPVGVLVLPVGDGVLTIRRGIEPRKGQLALPGGFMDFGDPSWRHSCARELCEETGIVVEPTTIELFDVHSVPGTLLVFGLAPKIDVAALPTFAPTNETTECVIAKEPQTLAFPTHTQVLADYFKRRSA